MDIPLVFIFYLTLFRLAIIAAGIISLVLGYRLFCRGVWPSEGERQQTTAEANIAGTRFTLKNAAPGTFFALFGVVIISIMFAKGSPELTLEMLHKTGLMDSKGAGQSTTKLQLRGHEPDTLHSFTQQGIQYEEQRDTPRAMAAYQNALTLMATPMNHLAWLYQSDGHLTAGLPLARLAVQLRPDEARFLDTLAVLLCKIGERTESLSLMEKAAQIDPTKFSVKLANLRSGSCP